MGVTPETEAAGPPLSSLRVAGGFVFLTGQGGFNTDHNLVDGGVAAETANLPQRRPASQECRFITRRRRLVPGTPGRPGRLRRPQRGVREALPREKPVRTTVRADLSLACMSRSRSSRSSLEPGLAQSPAPAFREAP